MAKKKMTEQAYKKKVYAEAEKVQNLPQFNKFWTGVREYPHDYGTIVYGCAAMMKAAFNVINRSKTGGITGFQAGAIGWEMAKEFFMFGDNPARFIDYGNLLYPQYESKFQKKLTEETWKWLQDKAKENLKKETDSHPNVRTHWESIAAGNVPFGFEIGSDE